MERDGVFTRHAIGIRTFLVTCLGGINLRTNGVVGRSNPRGSQNICGEGTAPAGFGPPSVSSKSLRGGEVARDGGLDSTSPRQVREARGDCGKRFRSFTYNGIKKRYKCRMECVRQTGRASLDTLESSVPPAVKLA